MTDVPAGHAGHGVETLRAATRVAHERLDHLVDLRAWDLATHRWWLQRMLGLHEPLEQQLGTPARRSGEIVADLHALGLNDDDVRALPRSPLPAIHSTAGRDLGRLYVLDGSALGGAVIATRAIATGVPAQACTSLAHSKQRITTWRQTRRRLDDLTPAQLDEATRSAVELFAVFEAWLRTPAPGRPDTAR